MPRAALSVERVGNPPEIPPLPSPVTPKPPSWSRCPHLPQGCLSPPTHCGQLPPALALGLPGVPRTHMWGPEAVVLSLWLKQNLRGASEDGLTPLHVWAGRKLNSKDHRTREGQGRWACSPTPPVVAGSPGPALWENPPNPPRPLAAGPVSGGGAGRPRPGVAPLTLDLGPQQHHRGC